jgi:hypothetical protein
MEAPSRPEGLGTGVERSRPKAAAKQARHYFGMNPDPSLGSRQPLPGVLGRSRVGSSPDVTTRSQRPRDKCGTSADLLDSAEWVRGPDLRFSW